jgi:hypothetical protein
MGLFGKKRPPPHPNLRELNGLRWCITAWRRAAIEHWFLDGVASREELTEKLSQLGWYNHAWDGADEFTNFVLSVPVGELDPSLLLGAHWRGETASAIAWALGLVDVIPPPSQRSDAATMETFFPLDDRPPGIAQARLRDRALIAAELAAWKQNLAAAAATRDRAALPDELAAFEFSRSYERARGLAWVLSSLAEIEDTPMD